MMHTMNAEMIISKLGGTNAVARLCEVRPPAVSQWRRDGIPRARLMYLKAVRPDVFCGPAIESCSQVSSLIDALGGTTKVAALCEVTKGAVSQWRKNGIPRDQLKFLRVVRPEVFSGSAIEAHEKQEAV